jgi:hypothetical protein
MTLRKLVFTIEQPLFDVALHLGVVVYGVPQLSKRFGEFGFDLALKDFSLQWEGEGRSSMHVKHSKIGRTEKRRGRVPCGAFFSTWLHSSPSRHCVAALLRKT